ncbi:MAG: hypothetical protein QMD36_06535 [Candidatus Aenigmarchaeota archaeon]|nr:hypothetical protein [Candidatus Aenigmarchaeota archaeon]
MMNKFGVLAIIFCLCILSIVSSVLSKQSSPIGQFNVTPDFLYLNWTNNYTSNITIEINQSYANISVKILNSSSNVVGNYSQTNPSTYCDPSYYHLFVINVNGEYNETVGPINESVNVTILDTSLEYNHLQCRPGRYWIQKFTIQNATLDDETANITVFIDIPISSSNNANILSTGIGSFGGQLPINSRTYHSYYFNTSLVPNATGIKINLTGWSLPKDMDLFLLDDSSLLKTKSINTTTTESLLYSYLPQGMMWEIRVYGNSTSPTDYSGSIIFTTLNVTNASNTAQQVSSIDFGSMNASETKQSNITLRNEGNLTLSSVTESKELYIIRRFGGNNAKNFTMLIPNSSIASKVKASLNWTGSSNYSLKIYDQSDTLLASSANKHINANVTDVMQEEYNETSSIGSNAGLWRFEATNTSTSGDPYNLTVYVYISPENWIRTNYSVMTFNRTGNNNYMRDVQINLTVQNNSFDGNYEGSLQYLDSNGAGIKIPISINVRTPMLVVNNSLSSMTSRIDENYGANLTRGLNFILNNTGYYDLSLTLTNSSGMLTCISSGCSGHFATLTYNQTTLISNYSSQTINVNITYNSSMPVGVYEGWIFINASNPSTSLSSHPYETFNLTLKLNLTRDLDVRTFDVVSVDGDKIVGNSSVAENITAKFKIYYINGSEIEAGNALNTSNFTIWLTHKNSTSYRIPETGGLSLYNGTNPIYITYYSVNFSVPQNKPGGWYDVHVVANYTKNPSYGGESVNQTLLINSSGVYLSAITTKTIRMDEGTTTYFNITAINYGPLTANGIITFSNSTCQYSGIVGIAAATGGTNCTGAIPSGNTWTNLGLSGNGTKVCRFDWVITSYNVSADRSCGPYLQITYNEPNLANITGINIYVYDTSVTTTTTTTPSQQGGEETTTTTIPRVTPKYLNISSYSSIVSVEQGGNKTERVTVNNINDTLLQHVNLTVLNIDPTWFSVSPSTKVRIENNTNYTFSVTFNIPENATVKDYAGKFYAESFYGSDTKTFTLRVTPGTRMQSEILANLSRYQSEVQELEKTINESKRKGWNNTEAEDLFNQLKEKLNLALNYVNASDYWSAYDLFDDIESLLNQTKTAMLKGEIVKGLWEWGRWVVVAVVGIAVVVLAYLFWPTPGFKLEKGHVPEKKEEKGILYEKFEKLKEKWKKVQEKR